MIVDIQNPADYWENRLKNNYGLHGTGFIGLGQNYNNWMYKIRKGLLIKKIKSLGIDIRKLKVLDVGCGTGFCLELWKELGVKSMDGIDITNTAVENLLKKYPDSHFYKADIGDNLENSLNQLRISYDVITSLDVLFHIVDDDRYKRAFRNIYELLRTGGFLIFSENFLHTENIRSAYQTSRSLRNIEDTILEAGFEIIRRSPLFVLMNTPIDTDSRLLHTHWKIITRGIIKDPKLSYMVGATLYPLEWILVRLLKEGPTTELMICRKM
jgi:2-polyprenyl-3-methyl-5-hydroxy-6-metoxy-1,4-benzoquinol methylase